MQNNEEVVEAPFNYVAIMERVSLGDSRPVMVTSDPETVAAVTLLLEKRLRKNQVHHPITGDRSQDDG